MNFYIYRYIKKKRKHREGFALQNCFGRRGEATNLEKLPNNKNYSLIPSARNYSKWIMSVQ